MTKTIWNTKENGLNMEVEKEKSDPEIGQNELRFNIQQNGLGDRMIGFVKKQLRFIQTKMPTNDGFEGDEKPKNEEKHPRSTIYEVESCKESKLEENQPSTSKQAPPSNKKPKKPTRSPEFHPKPPFSCTPVYAFILISLFLVLLVGAIHTIIDMKPSLFSRYSEVFVSNSTSSLNDTEIIYSTLKPQ